MDEDQKETKDGFSAGWTGQDGNAWNGCSVPLPDANFAWSGYSEQSDISMKIVLANNGRQYFYDIMKDDCGKFILPKEVAKFFEDKGVNPSKISTNEEIIK